MTGRDRRLAYEFGQLTERLEHHHEINLIVESRNQNGFPNRYLVEYNIRSISGVAEENGEPQFADRFLMRIDIPSDYPSVDAPAEYRFLTEDPDTHQPIAHPWHPNIRYYGELAGRVCLNAFDSFTDLAWGVLRVGEYLRYERYHAVNEPPYPEDQRVAAWVVRVGEPNDYIYF